MTLALDARQRAMLQEMGVMVWQPLVREQPAAPVVRVAAAPAAPPITPKTIATNRLDTLAPASFDVKPRISQSTGALPAGLEAMDWQALQAAAAHCSACALCSQRSQAVLGMGVQGGAGSTWLIVAEAPDDAADRAGQPVAGPAQQLLVHMLRAAGLSTQDATSPRARAGAYITTAVKCAPAASLNPEPTDLQQCSAYLARQVALLQPPVIFAMGRMAAVALLAPTVPEVATLPLGKLRGQVFHYQGIPVVVSYSAQALLRNPAEKAKAWVDLCLAISLTQK